jgi:hypothetical protein
MGFIRPRVAKAAGVGGEGRGGEGGRGGMVGLGGRDGGRGRGDMALQQHAHAAPPEKGGVRIGYRGRLLLRFSYRFPLRGPTVSVTRQCHRAAGCP